MEKTKRHLSCKFILDFFSDKNTIVRKKDGYKWRICMASYNIYDDTNGTWKCLGDESLCQFFDKNNNFLYNEYDIFYHDYFKDYFKKELKENGAKLINGLIDDALRGENTDRCEEILKQILKC